MYPPLCCCVLDVVDVVDVLTVEVDVDVDVVPTNLNPLFKFEFAFLISLGAATGRCIGSRFLRFMWNEVLQLDTRQTSDGVGMNECINNHSVEVPGTRYWIAYYCHIIFLDIRTLTLEVIRAVPDRADITPNSESWHHFSE